MKPIRWRAIFITILTLAAAYAVAPTIIYFLQPIAVRNDQDEFLKHVPTWLPQNHIKLGLDLQGGVQLALGVSTEGAIENRLGRAAVEVTRWAKDKNLGVETAFVSKEKGVLVVRLLSEQDAGAFNEALHNEFPYLNKLHRDELEMHFGYSEKEKEKIAQSALEQAERVIRSRVDHWGVTEPMINRRADGNILVQLPGFRNPERAKELLGRTAQLKFKIVDDTFIGFDKLRGTKHPEGISDANNEGQLSFSSESRDDLRAYLQAHVPDDRELLFSKKQLGEGAKYSWTSYVVHAATEITGDDIQDASILPGTQLDPTPFVSLKLNASGGKRFAEVTGDNVGKRLAIILDDVVESAPNIQERIPGGNARITLGGGRSYNDVMEEGKELSLILKSGAIPATIKVLEERQVGATLGPELATQGVKGALVGLLLVLFFMVLYYRRPGAIACFALVLNALFLLAFMAGFGFALTLPGIAGFVLSLGMAVDANVLINERIRQELREGKHPRKAVELGFKKVTSTVVDSNLTTLIAAVVLLETNTSGPISGFAITLILGLLVSMFTSLYCSRVMFDIVLGKVAEKNVKDWLGGIQAMKARIFRFNYLNVTRPATWIFVFLAASVLGTAAFRGMNFGVDFAGGTEVLVGFAQDIEPDKIRGLAEEAKIDSLSLQALEGGKRSYLLRYEESKEDAGGVKASASDTFIAFKTALLEKLQSFGPEIQQVGFVGPQVGKDLRNQGILSVLYAILAILIYIAFRFDMRFAPGAMVKMFLDVFVMAGFYVFFWASFDLVAVAAFLTVVGYSVNDTIVIYDRIRENIDENPRRTLRENVNFALNETLTRSINTSMTVALSLGGLLVFATGQIWDFAMAMTIGVVVATLSSIFVASNFVIWMEDWRKRRKENVKKVAGSTV
ncbi:MAG: protein translocase subunit SecD [Deltaproteobacteria bacterium]|nr:protein translocase subunit SecD [Deltaproteobacteria bacterium]